jgi:hypothetical protein
MKRFKITCVPKTYPTAKELATACGRQVLKQDSQFNCSGKMILNWGRSNLDNYRGIEGATIINHPEAVAIAANKLRTLEVIGQEFGLEYTTDPLVANEWRENNTTVFARYTLTGSGGEGIEVLHPVNVDDGEHSACEIRPAFLYTKYFNARYEFRVHVGKTSEGRWTVFDIQRKGLREDSTRSLGFVRNLENGYTFVRTDVVPADVPTDAIETMKAACSLAVQHIGLHFGAVDVRMKRTGEFKILEVNTAPGLSGTTLQNYVNFFEENL